ncbi:DsbA family oxidoreductase [Williamsia maris]|uniref:Dithiol-disulfide isomerase, DsbA family n=1 Tax=Williamsia maris TaxID=72806 RepID=A0ABT1HAN8_9NOCA|nr:DsbA family oxidoreductase [Williamsia maris]MCP2175304.1 putative dithiol-disulfide isomerase, DsbA family [Williamsia maris]
MSNPISVDVWSDIACPWCYVGKRRFEAGLAAFDGRDDVTLTYHSFELAPDTPVDFDGSEVDFLAQHKGIPVDKVEQMLTQMTGLAADEGLDFDYEALAHTNTRKAHEVLHFAKQRGLQLELAERLFAAYFTQGRHLGRDEELADLAAEVGLDRDEVLAALAGGEFVDAVDTDIDQARAYGISGVPFYVIDGRYGVSGAQQPEVFRSALEQARTDGQVAAQ